MPEPRIVEVRVTEVVPIKFLLTPTVRSTRQWNFLHTDWCDCEDGGVFLCYVEDGCCDCGIGRHHTHCKVCGGVKQLG